MDLKARLATIFLKVMGRQLDMQSFDDRLAVQKLIYTLKCAGISGFDYRFGWWQRGAYSSKLANLAFETSNELKKGTTLSYTFSADEQNILKLAIERFGEEIKDINKLELYASVLYLKKQSKLSDDELITEIKNLKPWYNDQEIKDALTKINNSNLFN